MKRCRGMVGNSVQKKGGNRKIGQKNRIKWLQTDYPPNSTFKTYNFETLSIPRFSKYFKKGIILTFRSFLEENHICPFGQ